MASLDRAKDTKTLLLALLAVSPACISMATMTKHGQAMSRDEAKAEMDICYEVAAKGVDFEHDWQEAMDGVARKWLTCLDERDVQIRGDDHGITVPPPHADIGRDDRECQVDDYQYAPDGTQRVRQSITDPRCIGRKGYIMVSAEVLREFQPEGS